MGNLGSIFTDQWDQAIASEGDGSFALGHKPRPSDVGMGGNDKGLKAISIVKDRLNILNS